MGEAAWPKASVYVCEAEFVWMQHNHTHTHTLSLSVAAWLGLPGEVQRWYQ